MKITRRNFFKKAIQSIAVIVIAPSVIPKLLAKEIPANPVPIITYEEYGEVVKIRKYKEEIKGYVERIESASSGCPDFKPYIEVREYKVDETPTYQDLSTDECDMCASGGKCLQNGKAFELEEFPEIWHNKPALEWYKKAGFTKPV